MRVKVCPKCGTQNLSSTLKCMSCGEYLSAGTLKDTDSGRFLSGPMDKEKEQDKTPKEDGPNKKLRYIIIGFVAGAIPGPIAWSMRWGGSIYLDGYSVFLLIIGGIAGAIGGLIGGSSTKDSWGAAIIGGLAGLLFGGLCSLNGL